MKETVAPRNLFTSISQEYGSSTSSEKSNLFLQLTDFARRHRPLLVPSEDPYLDERKEADLVDDLAKDSIQQDVSFPLAFELAQKSLHLLFCEENHKESSSPSTPPDQKMRRIAQRISTLTGSPEHTIQDSLLRVLQEYPLAKTKKSQTQILNDIADSIEKWLGVCRDLFERYTNEPNRIHELLQSAYRSPGSPYLARAEQEYDLCTRRVRHAAISLFVPRDAWGNNAKFEPKKLPVPILCRLNAFFELIRDQQIRQVGSPECLGPLAMQVGEKSTLSPKAREQVLEGICDAIVWRIRQIEEAQQHRRRRSFSEEAQANSGWVYQACFDLPEGRELHELTFHNEKGKSVLIPNRWSYLLGSAMCFGEELFHHPRFQALLRQEEPTRFNVFAPPNKAEEPIWNKHTESIARLVGYVRLTENCPELSSWSPEEFFLEAFMDRAAHAQPKMHPNANQQNTFLHHGNLKRMMNPRSHLDHSPYPPGHIVHLAATQPTLDKYPEELRQLIRQEKASTENHLDSDDWFKSLKRIHSYLMLVLYRRCDTSELQQLVTVLTQEKWKAIPPTLCYPVQALLEALSAPLQILPKQVYTRGFGAFGIDDILLDQLQQECSARMKKALADTSWWQEWTDEELQELFDSHTTESLHLEKYIYSTGDLEPESLGQILLSNLPSSELQRLRPDQAVRLHNSRYGSEEVFPGWSEQHAKICIERLIALEAICQEGWDGTNQVSEAAIACKRRCDEKNREAKRWVRYLQRTPRLFKEWLKPCPVKRLMFLSQEEIVSQTPTREAFDAASLPGILDCSANHLAPLIWLYEDASTYFTIDPRRIALDLAVQHDWARVYLQDFMSDSDENFRYISPLIIESFWQGQSSLSQFVEQIRTHEHYTAKDHRGESLQIREDKELDAIMEDTSLTHFPEWWSPAHTRYLNKRIIALKGPNKSPSHSMSTWELPHPQKAQEYLHTCLQRWKDDPAHLRSWLKEHLLFSFEQMSPSDFTCLFENPEDFEDLFPGCDFPEEQREAFEEHRANELDLTRKPKADWPNTKQVYHPSEILLALSEEQTWAQEMLREQVLTAKSAPTSRVWQAMCDNILSYDWMTDVVYELVLNRAEILSYYLSDLQLWLDAHRWEDTLGLRDLLEEKIPFQEQVENPLYQLYRSKNQENWSELTARLTALQPTPAVFDQALNKVPGLWLTDDTNRLQEWLLFTLEEERTFEVSDKGAVKAFPWLLRSAIHQLALGLQNPLTQSLRAVLEVIIKRKETGSRGGNKRHEPVTKMFLSAITELLDPNNASWQGEHPWTHEERALIYLILGVSSASKAMRMLKTQKQHLEAPIIQQACKLVLDQFTAFRDLAPRKRMDLMVSLLYCLHHKRRKEQPRERDKQNFEQCRLRLTAQS